jgi:glycosyltransferase involved in cell wall biosynthesis
MRVWLIKDGENLPSEPNARPMRTWMLADALLARGHDVTWWASTFSHHRKKLLFEQDTKILITPQFELRLLFAGAYYRHISLARHRHHARLAARFRTASASLTPPDVIVCAFPIIQLAFEVVNYAHRAGVPIVVDVRDLWPDTIVDLAPAPFRPLARLALHSSYRMTRELLLRADSVVAISSDSLGWALRRSGRSRRETDRVFPIGYPSQSTAEHRRSERLTQLAEAIRGKTLFSFAGSIGRAWDVQFLCEAAARLREHPRGGNIHFVLAGNGPGAREIERRTQKLENVTWLGWLDRHEMSDLLALAQVGLAPHRMATEALPNKVFEYLAAGLPILSSLHGEAERLIGGAGAGFTYKRGDMPRFIELATQLSTDPDLRAAMGERGRHLYDKICRLDVSYDAYAEHAEQIAARGPSSVSDVLHTRDPRISGSGAHESDSSESTSEVQRAV